jgi:hypothetical protein
MVVDAFENFVTDKVLEIIKIGIPLVGINLINEI